MTMVSKDPFSKLFTKAVAMVCACFIIFFVIVYEGLKFTREAFLQRSLSARRLGTYGQEEINAQIRTPSFVNRILSTDHLVQTLLHMVQVLIFCLMLVFMTYNVWLCLAVILGAGMGYFCFNWRRAVVVD